MTVEKCSAKRSNIYRAVSIIGASKDVTAIVTDEKVFVCDNCVLCVSLSSIGVTIGNVVEEHDGGADGPGLCRVADKSLSFCGAGCSCQLRARGSEKDLDCFLAVLR